MKTLLLTANLGMFWHILKILANFSRSNKKGCVELIARSEVWKTKPQDVQDVWYGIKRKYNTEEGPTEILIGGYKFPVQPIQVSLQFPTKSIRVYRGEGCAKLIFLFQKGLLCWSLNFVVLVVGLN